MALEFGKRACSLCRRRPRDEGGSGTCPLVPSSRLMYAAQEENGHDCIAFKIGDGRPRGSRVPPVADTQLELA